MCYLQAEVVVFLENDVICCDRIFCRPLANFETHDKGGLSLAAEALSSQPEFLHGRTIKIKGQ